MSYAKRMVKANPSEVSTSNTDALVECVEACFDCADACLGEEDPKRLMRCIRLNLDCADLCGTTGKALSRQVAFEPRMAEATLRACADACRLCGDECEKHVRETNAGHCLVYFRACRRCEAACFDLLSAIGI